VCLCERRERERRHEGEKQSAPVIWPGARPRNTKMVPEILLTVSAHIARSRRPLYASMCPFHDSTALPANPTLSAFDCLRFLLSSDVSFSEQSFTVRRLLNESTARPIGTKSPPSPEHFDPHFARNDSTTWRRQPQRGGRKPNTPRSKH
jgi:hypothetical protein